MLGLKALRSSFPEKSCFKDVGHARANAHCTSMLPLVINDMDVLNHYASLVGSSLVRGARCTPFAGEVHPFGPYFVVECYIFAYI